jgi:hypothetical protein
MTAGFTVSSLLMEADKRRPRSQQTELGMSDIGGCRRRAGYVLAGYEPTDPSASMQAVLGTAVDEAATRAVQLLQSEGLIPAEDLVQHEVRFAGVLGHLDWYHHTDGCVDDLKTVTQTTLGFVRRKGPVKKHRWQVHLYGAGLVKQGIPVRRVAITYVCRDSGDEWRWEAPFDPGVVAEALAWLDLVRAASPEQLPRDHDVDSPPCSWCPFRTECWGPDQAGRNPRVVLFHDDPDVAAWAAKLLTAREDKSDAEAREKTAKGALEAVDPGDKTPIDVGLPDVLLRFNRYPTERLDERAIRKDYEAAGVVPPTRTTWSTRVEFVPRRDDDLPVEVG